MEYLLFSLILVVMVGGFCSWYVLLFMVYAKVYLDYMRGERDNFSSHTLEYFPYKLLTTSAS